MSELRWRVGEESDDTIETVAVSLSILTAGGLCRRSIASWLSWVPAKYDSRGGGLRRLREARSIDHRATDGSGPGAAMRSAPIGILGVGTSLIEVVSNAISASLPTHGSSLGVAGAVGVSAAAWCGLSGGTGMEMVSCAQQAVFLAVKDRGNWKDAADLANGIAVAAGIVASVGLTRYSALWASLDASGLSGRGAMAVVPVAIAIGALSESAREAILAAANLGGDADTVSSIAGSLAAISELASIPAEWRDAVFPVGADSLELLGRRLALVSELGGKGPACTSAGWIVDRPTQCARCPGIAMAEGEAGRIWPSISEEGQ